MHISDPAIPFGSIVVIIGANGFMALETCEKALQAGYRVRGTVRDVAKHQGRLRKIFNTDWPGKFDLVEVQDYEAEGAFHEAFKGAAAVIFVSVPVILDSDPAKVVDPLIKGLHNSLEAAKSAGIQRFVLNSSSKAVDSADYTKPRRDLTVDTFNHSAVQEMHDGPKEDSFERIVTVYSAARTLHEMAFWDWIKNNNPPFIANCVVPDGQFGRVLDRYNIEHGISTNGQLKNALLGNWSALGLQLAFFSDVQDAARLLVAAAASASIINERIFCYHVNRSWNDMRKKVHELFPERSDVITGNNQDVVGQDLATAVKPIRRAEEILRHVGQSGFVAEADTLRDFVDGMYYCVHEARLG